MFHIITTTQLQQQIGKISAKIREKYFVVTSRGAPRLVILPYFEGCDQLLENYQEDFEMSQRREKLTKEFQESLASGISDFRI